MTIVQTQCCQFFILIKKELMLQMVVGLLLPRGWGVPIYNWKSYLQFEKIKSKSYVQWEKVRN